MDILNFISWLKGGRVVNTVDAAKTLLPVGLKDNKRDDGYLAGAITVEDFTTQVGDTLRSYKVLTINNINFSGLTLNDYFVLENTIGPFTISMFNENTIKITFTDYVDSGINIYKFYATSQQVFAAGYSVFQPNLEESNLELGYILFKNAEIGGDQLPISLDRGNLEIRIYN